MSNAPVGINGLNKYTIMCHMQMYPVTCDPKYYAIDFASVMILNKLLVNVSKFGAILCNIACDMSVND